MASRAERTAKRIIDISAASAGLFALSPLLLAIGVAELLIHGYPPLFKQARPGLGGRIFALRKFRTMTNAVGPDGQPLPDAERLTAFGRWLRSTSLDELPELWNVLRGEMSLVGPRPLLVKYLDRYSATQARRHEVLPGITGWAQINGRNGLSWDEKLALDVWYVDNRSLVLDLQILLKTVTTVLSRSGISADGDATMPEFLGERSKVGQSG